MGKPTALGEFEGIRAMRGKIQVRWPWGLSPYGNGEKYGHATYHATPTKTNKLAAFELRKRLLRAIDERTFTWREFFPEDPRARAEAEEEKKREAEAAARKVHQTIRNLLPEFLEYKQQPDNETGKTLTAVTAEKKYGKEVMFRMVPFLDVPMAHITHDVVKEHYKKNHSHLSNKSYNNSMSVMRGLWDYWIEKYEPKAINIFRLFKNKVVKKDSDPFPFTKKQMADIIEYMRQHYSVKIANFYELSYLIGARPGEMIAVTQDDYDHDRRTLRIHCNRSMGVDQDHTKTKRERTIQLGDRAVEIVEEQIRMNLAAGHKNRHLFLTEYGKEHRQIGNLRDGYWHPTLKALGIAYRVAYKVRHTNASHRLMASCVPAQVAHDLGHSLQMLYNVYGSYVNSGQAEKEMAKFESYLKDVEAMPAGQKSAAMEVLQAQLDQAKQMIEMQAKQLEFMQQLLLNQQTLQLDQNQKYGANTAQNTNLKLVK